MVGKKLIQKKVKPIGCLTSLAYTWNPNKKKKNGQENEDKEVKEEGNELK